MWANYAKVAWRCLTGNLLFSTINIVGLTVGLACCAVIALFVRYELSFDQQYRDAHRIVRVSRDFFSNNLRLAAVAPPIAPLLAQDFDEVEAAVRLLRSPGIALSREDRVILEDGAVFADPEVFDFFELPVVHGALTGALDVPTNVVLTERAANRYFGAEDPLGQTLSLMGQVDLKVAAVIEDLPDNTHMAFEVVGSMSLIPAFLGETELESWGSNNYYTYLRLRDGVDYRDLETQLPAFLVKHYDEDAESSTRLELQPIGDIHLRSDRDSEWRANGSIAVVYTFAAIAVVVLLIACINFMNLTTARSTQRAREVGVRKVVGARRVELIAQFLGESVLMTLIAMFFAVVLVELGLPIIGAFLEKPLDLDLTEPLVLLGIVGAALLVGLFAGSYPAFFLSSFQPAQVLKGSAASGSVRLRQGLVVFQFTMSISLLIATGVVVVQMEYARTTDLGLDRSRNLVTPLPFFQPLETSYEPMKAFLESSPGVSSVTYSSRVPGMQNLDGSGYIAAGVPLVRENAFGLSDIKVDYNWFDHYGVEVIAGRAFLENEMTTRAPTVEEPVTQGAVMLNESAAARFGWTAQEAVGQIVRDLQNAELTSFIDRTVVGVVEDFHFSSLHAEIKATIFAEPNANYGRWMSIKTTGDPRRAVQALEQIWSDIVPGEPVRWEFLEDRFDALYRAEQRQAEIFGLFALLAMVIATLGLYGLAAFSTERRTKEIGIRKVMGASVTDIVLLLTKDFSKLVTVAVFVAWPIAFFLMQDWLTRFAYQAPWTAWAWLFVAAGLAAFVLSWATIGAHAMHAARARPIGALRYE